MDFKDQPNYQKLRDIIAENTSPIVLWLGAGLSAPAGLPSWGKLRERLIDNGETEAALIEKSVGEKLLKDLNAARSMNNFWQSFSLIRKALGKSSYESKMRDIFEVADKADIPINYQLLMRLQPRGIITTNIDRLASKAYATHYRGKTSTEFSGLDCSNYLHLLQGEKEFILNLHGTHDNCTSWVFAQNELEQLQSNKGYKEWISACLLTKVIIFVGTQITDISIKTHLDRFKDTGAGYHFWLTSNNSSETKEFCDEHKILPVIYLEDNGHAQLNELIKDLITFKPIEQDTPPVTTAIENNSDLPIGSPEFDRASLNIQRCILNRKAAELIQPATQAAYKAYYDFRKKNNRYIHNAWYVSTEKPDNELLDYTIVSPIGSGAFGNVYMADDRYGQHVAIKLLKIDVLSDDSRLQAFRRGVHSMKILADRKIAGIVKYITSSEIPTLVVMDYIDGINLRQAVESKGINSWNERFKVLSSVAQIMKTAHHLPERVLHRDLRPQNVMLKGFYSADDWDVILLDFDLSWYKNANEISIDHSGGINGFLAPELVSFASGKTRNALVDSFGMGMLIYYVLSGKEPSFNQHMHSDWNYLNVKNTLCHYPCKEWHSIPYILARIIVKTTSAVQSERYDMSQIFGVLSSLHAAYLESSEVKSASMIAEEACCRVWEKTSKVFDYTWDENKLEAKIVQPSGGELTFSANETKRVILMNFSWKNKGDANYSTVRKKMPGTIDGIKSFMRRYNCCNTPNPSMQSDQLIVSANIHPMDLLSKLDEFSTDAATILEKSLKF